MPEFDKHHDRPAYIQADHPGDHDPVRTLVEQDLQRLGWQPAEMIDEETGVPFARWFPPGSIKGADPAGGGSP